MNRKQRRAAGKTGTLPAQPQIDTLNSQGIVYGRSGHHEQAMETFRHSLLLDPKQPRTWYNLGKSFGALNRKRDAKDAFAKAVALNPKYAEAHNGLGWCAVDMGLFQDAVDSFRRSITLHPHYAEVHANLGNALKHLGHLDESIAACQDAIRLNPNFADAYNSMGGALEYGEKLDEAIAAYKQACLLAPHHASAHANLALAYLKDGQFQKGWEDYEWRWQANALPFPRYPHTLWNGENIAGKTLLLWAEQGLGDTLHFIRYAALIAALGARVIAVVQPSLVRLLQSVPGIESVIPEGSPIPNCDYHLPLLSAPRVLGRPLPEHAPNNPYIAADSDDVAHWQRKLSSLSGPKVGLVWAGNSHLGLKNNDSVDRRRSLHLQKMRSILQNPGISFISLQLDEPAKQIAEIEEQYRPLDVMSDISDFSETAAIVACLDLVISVDTSVAHLAGAMGKPVWLLSRFDGCWRWLRDRDDSPWYPSMTLFRQTQWGEWDDVITRVQNRLSTTAPDYAFLPPAK